MWGWQPEPSDCQRVPQRFEFDVNYSKLYYRFKRYTIRSKLNKIIEVWMNMKRHMLLCGIILSVLFAMPFANGQEFEKTSLQESLTVVYDQKLSNSIVVSIGLETTDNDEIRITDEVTKKINDNNKIRSVVFTNTGDCVIGVTSEEQCIMVNFDYEKLKGDGGIRMVQESAKEMGNDLIQELNEIFGVNTEFHSIFIHTKDDANILLETSGAVSGRGSVSAVYTMPKQSTDFLFADLAGRLISKEIRDGGGFYDITKKIAKNDEAIISISILRHGDSNLIMFKVANEFKTDTLDITKINVLEHIEVDEISRSDLFDNKNAPLNSVIHLVVIPNKQSQINAIATHAITDVTKLENVSKKGWFFGSPAGNVIDGKFLFGQDKTAIRDELKVEISEWDGESTITLYSVEDIPKQEEYESIDEFVKEKENVDETQYAVLGIIIVVGIGAAIFYLKGYKAKH